MVCEKFPSLNILVCLPVFCALFAGTEEEAAAFHVAGVLGVCFLHLLVWMLICLL